MRQKNAKALLSADGLESLPLENGDEVRINYLRRGTNQPHSTFDAFFFRPFAHQARMGKKL
jgi:hypothetical protein